MGLCFGKSIISVLETFLEYAAMPTYKMWHMTLETLTFLKVLHMCTKEDLKSLGESTCYKISNKCGANFNKCLKG